VRLKGAGAWAEICRGRQTGQPIEWAVAPNQVVKQRRWRCPAVRAFSKVECKRGYAGSTYKRRMFALESHRWADGPHR
jgi:hypothetical protein